MMANLMSNMYVWIVIGIVVVVALAYLMKNK